MDSQRQLLTAHDVHNVMFDTTRFRQGYDMDMVDMFLDRVEKSHKILSEYALKQYQENQRLKEQLGKLSHALARGNREMTVAHGKD